MSYCPQCAEYEARLTELRDERDQAVLDASEFQDKWDREIDRRQDAESRATAAEAANAKLREALREHCIEKTADFRGRLLRCKQCLTAWTPDDDECHQPDCLAAPW